MDSRDNTGHLLRVKCAEALATTRFSGQGLSGRAHRSAEPFIPYRGSSPGFPGEPSGAYLFRAFCSEQVTLLFRGHRNNQDWTGRMGRCRGYPSRRKPNAHEGGERCGRSPPQQQTQRQRPDAELPAQATERHGCGEHLGNAGQLQGYCCAVGEDEEGRRNRQLKHEVPCHCVFYGTSVDAHAKTRHQKTSTWPFP